MIFILFDDNLLMSTCPGLILKYQYSYVHDIWVINDVVCTITIILHLFIVLFKSKMFISVNMSV